MLRVTKRSGELENVSFDKVLNRLNNLSDKLNVNYYEIAQKVCSRIYDLVKTSELDELAANLCSSMIINHPDYGVLAARIIISNHHKNTSPSFSETIYQLYHNKKYQLVTKELYDVVMQNKEKLNNYIKYDRDFNLDYFGFKTLERSYLLKVDNKIVERPQHLFMRVSLGIHGTDLKDALQTYDYMSQKYFVHATPTLFNSGTLCPQLSSCFLLSVSDSIESIYDTLKECAQISKLAGGIGIHIHDIRANGSKIRHTGVSNGIVPMLKVFNDTARYVNQEGKRNGSIAVYLEPHHADIFDFLDMKRPHGSEELKARDLFYALWISDLFMERVKNNAKWSLMTPNECVGLSDVYGDEYKQLYEQYERDGKFVRQVDAQELWFKMLECQIESGVPYIGYKDAINMKTNQKNLGTIKSSNLCIEIVEFTSPEEIAVCNLASINLERFVNLNSDNEPYFDFEKLHEVSMILTKNLNKIIDINHYPLEKARRSNLRHRPIGIGVQNLHGAYMKMKYNFDSPDAYELNKLIFETIYHGALQQSMFIAKIRSQIIQEGNIELYNLKLNEYENLDEMQNNGYVGAYSTFYGSPAQQGILQFDLWKTQPDSTRYNWEQLKTDIKTYGLRNSLLLALMPTASTSQILGSVSEAFEPITSNLYKRKTLSGEFIVINNYLVNDLISLGLWTEDIKNKIIINEGCISTIEEIPQHIRNLYKTAFELSQKVLIDQAADRGKYICQTQSMNLFVENPDTKKLSSMHFYAWSKGLKTGIYYLRSKTKSRAQKFTIDPELQKYTNLKSENKSKRIFKCKDEEEGGICTMCSS